MKKNKELIVIILMLAVIITILVSFYSTEGKTELEYKGIEIYQAIDKAQYLNSHGFVYNVYVEGKNRQGKTINLKGKVLDTERGFFVVNSDKGVRIVEGPAGKQDIKSTSIIFKTNMPYVAELVYPPYSGFNEFSDKLDKYRKIKGSISVETNSPISPIILQEIENMDTNFYFSKYIQIKNFLKGFKILLKQPINSQKLNNILLSVNKTYGIKDIKTGKIYFYRGVDSEEEIKQISGNISSQVLIRRYPAG